MQNPPFRVLQISDIHLYDNPNQELLGVNTHVSFRAVVDMIIDSSENPDMIILSGDLSQDGSVYSYTTVADMLSDLEVPVYWIPGNHDNPKIMADVYPYDYFISEKQIIKGDWQFILLDSHKHGAVEGYLAKNQLSFLQECLEKYPNHYAVVVLHHHPVPVNVRWLDKLGLMNSNDFWGILKLFPKVHTVLFGHIHQVCEGEKNGIRYYSLPSTCIQFKPNTQEFGLDHIPQGYRWLNFFPKGELQTGIIRLPHYSGHFDENAKGY